MVKPKCSPGIRTGTASMAGPEGNQHILDHMRNDDRARHQDISSASLSRTRVVVQKFSSHVCRETFKRTSDPNPHWNHSL